MNFDINYHHTGCRVHQRVQWPENLKLHFLPLNIQHDGDEPVEHSFTQRLRKEADITPEHEVMLLMYSNINLYHLLRESILPALGIQDVRPLMGEIERKGVPVAYGSFLLPQSRHAARERYAGKYRCFVGSKAHLKWGGKRNVQEDVRLETLVFESLWHDRSIQLPSHVHSFLTTTEEHADLVQHSVYRKALENLVL